MSSLKSRKVAASLKKKGFKEEVWKKGHTFYHFCYLGKEYPIRTRMSRGTHGDEIGDNLIKAMAEQLFLSRQEFHDLVECPLTETKYVELMSARGKLV